MNWILGKAILIIESNIGWIIFWQNSNIELNQIGYWTPPTSSYTFYFWDNPQGQMSTQWHDVPSSALDWALNCQMLRPSRSRSMHPFFWEFELEPNLPLGRWKNPESITNLITDHSSQNHVFGTYFHHWASPIFLHSPPLIWGKFPIQIKIQVLGFESEYSKLDARIKTFLILSQNVKYGTFVANVTKNLRYALWENNSGSNSLRESSASCEGLVS